MGWTSSTWIFVENEEFYIYKITVKFKLGQIKSHLSINFRKPGHAAELNHCMPIQVRSRINWKLAGLASGNLKLKLYEPQNAEARRSI